MIIAKSEIGNRKANAPRRSVLLLVVATVLLVALAAPAFAEPSPPPDFEGTHQLPSTATPPPRTRLLQYVDVAVLAAALTLAAVMAHVWRWRRGLLGLMLFSLVYFGFYRNGCICAIGAIQNVALSVADGSGLPLPALAFLTLPIAFALVAGRVFCGAVCPLGAIQDLFIALPLRVPRALERALRVIPYVYLAAAVAMAAAAGVFLICQLDPFVGFFRLAGPLPMLLTGGALLVLGMLVARPYCRYLCPLGVVLGLASRLSIRPVTVTPKECINCRLCEESCPFSAIHKPDLFKPAPPARARKAALAAAIAAVLPLALAGAWLGGGLSMWAAQAHPIVRQAQQVHLAQEAPDADGDVAPGTAGGLQLACTVEERQAFEQTHRPAQELYVEASAVTHRILWACRLAGAFVGLVIGLKLVAACVSRRRKEYVADRAACLACGRCFDYCPVERARRLGKIVELSAR